MHLHQRTDDLNQLVAQHYHATMSLWVVGDLKKHQNGRKYINLQITLKIFQCLSSGRKYKLDENPENTAKNSSFPLCINSIFLFFFLNYNKRC